MKIIAVLSLVLIGLLFLQSIPVDGVTEESLNLRVFNPRLRLSDDQMLAILNKTDLESHGYKKEVVTKLTRESGPNGEQIFQKSYLYFKIIDCSRLREIDQELQTLMPGIFGVDIVQKIKREIKTKSLTSMKKCKVGLEVHFRETEGCTDKNKTVRRRKRGCSWCVLCWNAQLSS